MKITVDLPDELVRAAKRRAKALRCSLDSLIERVLRNDLQAAKRPSRRRRIRWVTVEGGVAPGVDLSSRESMYRLIGRDLDA